MFNEDTIRLLNEVHYAIDFRMLVGDLRDFLGIAENTARELHETELDRIALEFPGPPEDDDEGDYWSERQHYLDMAEFRFVQALSTRIRYSVVTGLVTAIDYASVDLKRSARRPKIASKDSVVVFRTLLERLGNGPGNPALELINDLIAVRNAIAHGAGTRRLARPGNTKDIDAVVARLPGFGFKHYLLIGDAIFIEGDALSPILDEVETFIIDVTKRCYEGGLMKPHR